ncbi:retron St85 family effector protein [Magnetovibrio sp. PR-2]|uniref:retron St85 family effector protein n=1 Tax=Magnetovibrio sp. PR-2 TaxID=3120356 RepID=UPI002FCDE5BD
MNPYIERFTKSIDVFKSRVANTSDHIFFCGGPKNPELDHGAKPHSARDYILRKTLVHKTSLYERFYLEENMREWLFGGHFQDLASFERHVSQICSLVFLISESPGSYAELGAFAHDEDISERLFVVINSSIDNDESYISLGPILKLREIDEDKVLTFRWGAVFETGKPPRINEGHLDDVWESIINKLLEYEEKIKTETKLDKNNSGHVSLMLLDVLKVYGAATVRELVEAMQNVIPGVTESDVKRHLFVLDKLDLITIRTHGRKFYVSNSDLRHINIDYVEGTDTDISDRTRLGVLVREWFEKEDPGRYKVIKRHAAEVPDE